MNLNDRLNFRQPMTFETLPELLELFALNIPFENSAVLQQDKAPISPDYLIEKIIVKGEGGLCYDLNPLLYVYLKDNGFDVTMLSGHVSNAETSTYQGRTHVLLMLKHENKAYIVDTGFGGNIPLIPVPMDGTTVTSVKGSFKIVDEGSVSYFHMKKPGEEWTIGYKFYADEPIDFDDVTDIKMTITNNPQSHFNKGLIATKYTAQGQMTLSEHTFKIGAQQSEIDKHDRKKLFEQYFRAKV